MGIRLEVCGDVVVLALLGRQEEALLPGSVPGLAMVAEAQRE